MALFEEIEEKSTEDEITLAVPTYEVKDTADAVVLTLPIGGQVTLTDGDSLEYLCKVISVRDDDRIVLEPIGAV